MRLTAKLTRCLGLDPGVAGDGLVVDPDAGSYALARAVNVDIGPKGAVSRRTGFARIREGAFHSLWSSGREAFAVTGGALAAVGADGSAVPLRTGLTPDAPMSYAFTAGRTFFANGFEKGIIRDGICEDWGGRPYPGPDAAGVMGDPPAGRFLAAYAGRIFIAREHMVHFTGAAGLFHWADRQAGHLAPFDAEVRMLGAVRDGLYVGTGRGVVFLRGTSPSEFILREVCRTPPVAGAFTLLRGDAPAAVAGTALDGPALVFAGEDGLYLGKSGGAVTRLKAVPGMGGSRGCALAGDNAFLALIEP